MSLVTFSGTASGIDWAALIDATVEARRIQTINPLERRHQAYDTKLSTFDELRSLLAGLREAAQDMDSPAELRSHTVSSSDEDTVTAAVSGDAIEGSYSLLVNQLASPEVEVHSGLDAAETVVNNSGSARQFTYTYGEESVTVEVLDGATLADLRDLINNDAANPGVSASILDDGGGASSHHLVLSGRDSGADNTIAIDGPNTTLSGEWATLTADAGAGGSTLSVDDASPFHAYQAVLVADDDSASEAHIVESVGAGSLTLRGTLADNFSTAQNATVTPRGIGSALGGAVSGGATEINVADAAAFQAGKTIIIADASLYEEATISAVDATANTITVSTALTNGYAADGYVTQLEGGRKFTFQPADFEESLTAANAQVRVNGYPSGEWIERSSNTVTDLIQGLTINLRATTAGSPATLSVNADLEGIKEKIQSFVDAYNEVKRFLNEQTAYDQDTDRAGRLLGNYTVDLLNRRLQDVLIGPATGFAEGADTHTLLANIGVESQASGEEAYSLGTLTFDESRFDEAFADDPEGVISLLSAHFAGASDSDDITFYQASETLTEPGAYDVEVDFDGAGNITAARIKLDSESTFRDATVDGSYVVGQSGNPEEGLWLRATWDGSSTTQTAQVRVKQGFAGMMDSALDDILDTSEGLIHNTTESLNDSIDQIEDRIAGEEQRLARLRQRLVRRYAQLEELLAQLQAQQAWVSNMAASLAPTSSGN